MSNNTYGLMIDYEYCTGCHSCEVACKKEHDLAVGQWGIKLLPYGPTKKPDGKYELKYIPLPTAQRDLCEDRVAMGKLPTCVHHCQSRTMSWGTLKELAQEMEGRTNCVLFTPTR